jgi:hypothetical protein
MLPEPIIPMFKLRLLSASVARRSLLGREPQRGGDALLQVLDRGAPGMGIIAPKPTAWDLPSLR